MIAAVTQQLVIGHAVARHVEGVVRRAAKIQIHSLSQAGTAGLAHGRGTNSATENDSPRWEPINIRRAHRHLAETAQPIGMVLVGNEKKKIGSLFHGRFIRRRCRQDAAYRRSCQQCAAHFAKELSPRARRCCKGVMVYDLFLIFVAKVPRIHAPLFLIEFAEHTSSFQLSSVRTTGSVTLHRPASPVAKVTSVPLNSARATPAAENITTTCRSSPSGRPSVTDASSKKPLRRLVRSKRLRE